MAARLAIRKRHIPSPIPKDSARIYREFLTKNDVVIEVGSMFGGGTCVLAQLAKQVYSFEPMKENFWITYANTRKFSNVRVFNIALSDQNGEAELNLFSKDGIVTSRGASSLEDSSKTFWTELKHIGKEKIRQERLENVRFDFRPTALVSDCEGSEYRVLLGLGNKIHQLKTLLIETHGDSWRQLQQFFERETDFQTSYNVGFEKWFIARKKQCH